MPVDTKHSAYDAYADKWTRCRNCYDGEDAVKARGETYLPKPGGLDGAEYKAYLQRAVFYEAVGKTVDGFVGAITRRPHHIDVPTMLQPMLADATTTGVALDELVKQLCAEVLLMGRGGLLVDYDNELQRPYLTFYPTEAITNWSENQIILHETVYEADPVDRFKQVAIEQYRELTMIEGVCVVNFWRKAAIRQGADALASEWVIYKTVTPTRIGNKPIDKLPFFWLSPIGPTSQVVKPPLLGLVSLSLSHYRLTTDLLHGAHFTGLPTLYATGLSEQDAPIRVGASAIITIADPAAKVGYAEFTGQGLGTLERMLAATEQRMAAMGAAILGAEASKRPETATAAAIRHSGETSLLSAAVSAVQATLQAALEFAAHWISATGNVAVELNSDFVSKPMDGRTLMALTAAYQSGALTLSAFLQALADGDVIPQTAVTTGEAARLRAVPREAAA